MPTSLITQQEFWTLTDTELSVGDFMDKYLIPTSEKVRKYCCTDFGVQDITGERRMSPLTLDQDLRVDFIVKPVVSVTSVVLAYGSSTVSLSLTNADLFQAAGYMLIPIASTLCSSRVMRSGTGVGYLTLGDEYITESAYTGGAEIPLPVKEAVALLAWESYLVKLATRTSGDPSGGAVKSYSIGRYSETRGKLHEGAAEIPGTLSWGTALGQRAEEMLLNYQKPGVVFLGVL